MNTKSKIQLISEEFELKNMFSESLQDMMEKYIIEDSVFVFNEGQLKEVVKGYFVIDKDVLNIREAVRSINMNNGAVRIKNNKLQVGVVYKTLSECPRDKQIMDITNNSEIY